MRHNVVPVLKEHSCGETQVWEWQYCNEKWQKYDLNEAREFREEPGQHQHSWESSHFLVTNPLLFTDQGALPAAFILTACSAFSETKLSGRQAALGRSGSCQNKTWRRKCPKSWCSFVTTALKIVECVSFCFVVDKWGVGFFQIMYFDFFYPRSNVFHKPDGGFANTCVVFWDPALYLKHSHLLLYKSVSRSPVIPTLLHTVLGHMPGTMNIAPLVSYFLLNTEGTFWHSCFMHDFLPNV